jgi:hypothetical protein
MSNTCLSTDTDPKQPEPKQVQKMSMTRTYLTETIEEGCGQELQDERSHNQLFLTDRSLSPPITQKKRLRKRQLSVSV